MVPGDALDVPPIGEECGADCSGADVEPLPDLIIPLLLASHERAEDFLVTLGAQAVGTPFVPVLSAEDLHHTRREKPRDIPGRKRPVASSRKAVTPFNSCAVP
jgi:hypothetical protein